MELIFLLALFGIALLLFLNVGSFLIVVAGIVLVLGWLPWWAILLLGLAWLLWPEDEPT